MALPSARYEPRRPTEGAVDQIVREHFETFRAAMIIGVFVTATHLAARLLLRLDGS